MSDEDRVEIADDQSTTPKGNLSARKHRKASLRSIAGWFLVVAAQSSPALKKQR
jgi:hypothetical protein